MKALILAAAMVAGCINENTTTPELPVPTPAVQATYLCVGMESSARFGACPGCKKDAESLSALMADKFGYTGTTLISEKATKAAVVQKLKEGLEATPEDGLFLFFYSGHGGSDKFWDTGADETDGKDEFYCLYDTYLRDNEMWRLISKAKGRVLLINDCCHSQSLFHAPSCRGITMKKCDPLAATHTAPGTISMQCWSGCPDNTYSYGSSTGGQFTNTLLKYFHPAKTYDYLWEEIERDANLQRFEEVQRTVMGTGFVAKPIFR